MQSTPQLEFEAPPDLAVFRDRFRSIDPKNFAEIVRLVGLDDPGPAIRVILASETSDLARQTSEWIAGFAVSSSSVVVIFPQRSPTYPHNSLEDVLRHEIAHVLISRAAKGQPIPRWFNEGLAMAAERRRRFEDQTRALYEFVLRRRATLNEVDRLFVGDRSSQDRAYTLSGAFIRDLMRRYGDAAPAMVLERVSPRVPFEMAFADAFGAKMVDVESEFWRRQKIWTTWVPIVTSSAVLWLLVTFIALLAIRSRRRKDAAIRKKWDEEEPFDDGSDSVEH